ncbi:MAG: DMT family transporter [Eubacterium sp.]|nr:DMT family transporter [Eubacterium sp.]
MKRKNYKSPILLFSAALIWGTAFVAQSQSTGRIGPYFFNACRFFLGMLVLIPVILLVDRMRKKLLPDSSDLPSAKSEYKAAERKNLLIGGLVCGVLMFISSAFQQVGLQYTTAGKSGFITALYIVLVAIFGLFFGRKPSKSIILAIFLAVIGLYLLCIKEGFSINKGDIITLGCSVGFSFHILAVDYFSPKVDGIKLSCIQFAVAGLISLIPAFLFETPAVSQIWNAGFQIFYLGVFSSGVAYTFQIVGQKGMNPTIASLILSLESVISALSGWIILGDALSLKEIAGCLLMFSAIIIAQFPEKKK